MLAKKQTNNNVKTKPKEGERGKVKITVEDWIFDENCKREKAMKNREEASSVEEVYEKKLSWKRGQRQQERG